MGYTRVRHESRSERTDHDSRDQVAQKGGQAEPCRCQAKDKSQADPCCDYGDESSVMCDEPIIPNLRGEGTALTEADRASDSISRKNLIGDSAIRPVSTCAGLSVVVTATV